MDVGASAPPSPSHAATIQDQGEAALADLGVVLLADAALPAAAAGPLQHLAGMLAPVDDYPALFRARRRRERWSDADVERHRRRSHGSHGEAKTWQGLARAVRRGR